MRTDQAACDIRKEKTEDTFDAAQRQRIGQIEDVQQGAEYNDVLQQEADLITGHRILRTTGLIAVSAQDPDELERAVVDIEQAAIQASCETRRLWGQQAQAFSAAALPLCRSAWQESATLVGRRAVASIELTNRICPADLTMTLRQSCMLAVMSIPPTTNQVQGPAIHLHGLEKSYKELRVLRGVHLEVARGSIFALLGSNGAGKTTVVKILSTLLKADTGTARVNGFDVATQAADVRESISLTGQFAAVDEILSGRENLVLVARLRHLKDPGAIADDLLRRFSLTEAGTRRVATYSGGMRRRLDIAMSLIGNPPVIYLDEPTAGLDPQARIEVWQAVKELAEGGTTVLLTTQYLDEAEQLADRIAILHQGRIIVNGTLAELKQLLPPAKVEYVEKQPSLEDVFFAVVGDTGEQK
jgi:ABC-2 type transport system ATP-binding protein